MRDILKGIKEFNEDRLPDLVQLKYKLMSENIFRFYRGTCHLFYEDLHLGKSLPESPLSWICGDLHLENFGSYKGDNRLVYFDLNDFDEAILAPVLLEVVRLVTSIFVAFESLEIEQHKALNMAQLFLKTYSEILSRGKAYYIEPRIAKDIIREFLNAVSKRRQDVVLRKHTFKGNDHLKINKHKAKRFKVEQPLREQLNQHISDWISSNNDGPYNFEPVDVAFRIAGTGSLGLKRYEFLLRSLKKDNGYMLVEMKEARSSSLLPYVTVPQPEWTTEAERIVSIQQRMQNIPPALLSHTVFDGVPYMIQEMQPVKDSINFNLIKDRYRDICHVIDDMAILTASAQLRSSGREGAASADELISFGQDTKWQKHLLDYAQYYTAEVQSNYREFIVAQKEGYFDI